MGVEKEEEEEESSSTRRDLPERHRVEKDSGEVAVVGGTRGGSRGLCS